MSGLVFEKQAPVVARSVNRADIACFVGFVGRRNTAISDEIRRWLREQGWYDPPYGSSDEKIDLLLDLPVPIDTWDAFDRLFEWEKRPLDGKQQFCVSYLGAAVRSFFAQGGRKCYVIRVGDPWPYNASLAARAAEIKNLIPGYPNSLDCSPVDRFTWSGVGHIFGLSEVSFLCLPDLVDAVKAESKKIGKAETLPLPEEQFAECSDAEPPPFEELAASRYFAPRCDEEGYKTWAGALRLIADLIARNPGVAHLREVQLIAAVPIPEAGSEAERDLLQFFTDRWPVQDEGPLSTHPSSAATGLSSAFAQLAYPWARTHGSAKLPEQLESPDGILAGVLARNALTRGAFRSAANLHLTDVYDLHPIVQRQHLLKPARKGNQAARQSLLERVSLLGPTPSGLKLLSDVTTSLNESYRPASINRLVSAIARAARRLGEEMTFEPSGERLWAQLRESLNQLLTGLFQANALRGARAEEAFNVRCDRSTMSQNDIDNGRVIAHVQFEAAHPLESIIVVLAMDEGGQVSLVSAQEATGEVV